MAFTTETGTSGSCSHFVKKGLTRLGAIAVYEAYVPL